MACAHLLGGRGTLPYRWTLPVKCLQDYGGPLWRRFTSGREGGVMATRWSLPPTARAHWLGGRGVVPIHRLLPMQRMRGL